MRVCLLPVFKPDAVGGVAEVVRKLAGALPAAGVELVDLPGAADVVHGHALIEDADVARLHVYTNHGVYVEQGAHGATNRMIYRHMAAADVVTTVAAWPVPFYADFTGVKPLHIANGVELAELDGVKAGQFKKRQGVGKGVKTALFPKATVNNLVTHRAFERALAVAHTCRDVVFFFTGWLKDVPVPDNVKVIGRQPHAHMLEAIRDCDVLLSTCVENCPVAVLEAMALRRPVLWLAEGGNMELAPAGASFMDNDVPGIAEAMYACLDRRKLGPALKEARQRVEQQYTWANIAKQYVAAYEQALGARNWRAGGYGAEEGGVTASIVITNYNMGALLKAAVHSALYQIFDGGYEVIVVDDCSTDDSLAQLGDMLEKVKLLRMPINSGPAEARNAGVRAARGEYVCCLDGDDILHGRYLAELVPLMQADRSVGIVSPAWQTVNEKDGKKGPEFRATEGTSFGRLARANFVPCMSLFRRAAWERAGGYKDINPSWEDYEFWISIVEAGYTIKAHTGPVVASYTLRDKAGRNLASQAHSARLRAVVNTYHPLVYKPTVSVVVPVYSHVPMLGDALRSLFAQTHQDFECIVVDDCVPDPVAVRATIEQAVPDELGRRIKLIRHEENLGLSAARNTGIAMARGYRVLPLDDDDKLSENYLAHCLDVLRGAGGPDECFAYAHFLPWYGVQADGSDKVGELIKLPIEYSFDELVKRAWLLSAIMYPRAAWEKVGGYDERFQWGLEDWDFALKLGEACYCGMLAPDARFYYRQHAKASDSMRQAMKARNMYRAKAQVVANHYPVFVKGERPMCKSCGKARMVPQKPLEGPALKTAQAAAVNPAAKLDPVDGLVKMHYIGRHNASVSVLGYSAGLQAPNIQVKASHVQRLLDSGMFETGWM